MFAEALERVLAARDHGDDRAELVALLDAWRLVPDPQLAEMIAAVSLRVERVVTRGFGHMDRVKLSRLLEIARRGDPEHLGWVVPLFGPAGYTEPDLAVLAALPPDPRIAAAIPALASWRGVGATMFDGLRARHAPAAVAIPDAAIALHARAIAPMLEHARGERPLLEQIWANPDDDGPRQVYADWLLERDHPRGELIALELARSRGELSKPDQRRVKRLHDRFQHEWLGPLGPFVSYGSSRRGFVESANLRPCNTFEAALGHPEWATVRSITLSPTDQTRVHAPPPGALELVVQLATRNLRKLAGTDANFLDALTRQTTPLRLTELRMDGSRSPTASERDRLRETEVFADLHTFVAAMSPTDLSWLAGSTLGAQLEHLELRVQPGAEAARWLEAFVAGQYPRLRRIELELGGSRLIATAGVLTLREPDTRAVATLDALAPRTFTTLQLEGTVRDRDALVVAAARHGGFV